VTYVWLCQSPKPRRPPCPIIFWAAPPPRKNRRFIFRRRQFSVQRGASKIFQQINLKKNPARRRRTKNNRLRALGYVTVKKKRKKWCSTITLRKMFILNKKKNNFGRVLYRGRIAFFFCTMLN
jgi:hypothetical protein